MSTFKHNKVDIYIKEKSGKRQIRVPWLPETIEYESGGITVASYDIIRRGEVSVPTGTGLAKISWSSIFPGANRGNNSLQRGTWNAPSYYHKILEEWRTSGTTLNVMVTGYPINKDCFITAYSATPTGGFGDMEYNLELTEDRDITITTKKIKTKDQNANKKRPTAANKTAESTGTAYTIKSGDTLWEIAYKFYNDGSKWRQIYEANKEIIESTAKERGYGSSQNGHWIFPGVTIKIPGASQMVNSGYSSGSGSTSYSSGGSSESSGSSAATTTQNTGPAMPTPWWAAGYKSKAPSSITGNGQGAHR